MDRDDAISLSSRIVRGMTVDMRLMPQRLSGSLGGVHWKPLKPVLRRPLGGSLITAPGGVTSWNVNTCLLKQEVLPDEAPIRAFANRLYPRPRVGALRRLAGAIL